MVRIGEASGALAEVLKRLVEHFERVQDLKEKVFMPEPYHNHNGCQRRLPSFFPCERQP